MKKKRIGDLLSRGMNGLLTWRGRVDFATALGAMVLFAVTPVGAVSFSVTPTTSAPASVKPGSSFRVDYAYDVTDHADFDLDKGVQVRIELRKPGASSSTFNSYTYSGSSCVARSNTADWLVKKPYYGEYGLFDLRAVVSSGENGGNIIGGTVYHEVSFAGAVTIQDNAAYRADLGLTPSTINVEEPQSVNFSLSIANIGTANDSYDISLAGAGWSFSGLPYRPFIGQGQTRTWNCSATPPSSMVDGNERNAIITLLSRATGSRVDQEEIRVAIRNTVSIENVRARQISGTKDVEILYDLVGPTGASAAVTASATAAGVAAPVTSVTGDVGAQVVNVGTDRRIVWNAGHDWDDRVTDSMKVTVSAEGTAPAVPSGMVLIPAGTNAGTDPDFGAYSLTVSSFYMDKYEVTKALWDDVYAWAIAHGYSFDNAGSGKAANHPVHTVSWHDVVKWCNARSQKEGRPAVYTVDGAVYKTGQEFDVVQSSAAGYRLPTDVEWEYAARGGLSGRRFPWGDTITHSQANYNSYWSGGVPCYAYDDAITEGYHPTYNDGVYPYTSPVGAFAANGYGLYDMAGNVWEWCFDWYPEFVGSYRVVRGGGWAYGANYCQVGFRFIFWPGIAYFDFGFRAVLPPGQQ